MNENDRDTLLIVDDSQEILDALTRILQDEYRVIQASSGREALEKVAESPRPRLVLLDIMMPGMDGYEVITSLKEDERTRNIPVIFITGLGHSDNEAKGFELGAVDYISKPLSVPVVRARVRNHLQLKAYQDSLQEVADMRNMELDLTLTHLRKAFTELNGAHDLLRSAWIETVHRLSRAAEYKDEETRDHIKRVGLYTRELAATMGMDREFIETIYHSAPIHDIGKVGVPDEILLKPGKLNPNELEKMEAHTTIGASILEGSDSSFLVMAREIAISHHERWDGTGYPLGLAGEDIPLAGRIMNIVDQYDALRSRRPFKSSFSHAKAVEIITGGDGRTLPDHFDPAVLNGFVKCAAKCNEIYHSLAD